MTDTGWQPISTAPEEGWVYVKSRRGIVRHAWLDPRIPVIQGARNAYESPTARGACLRAVAWKPLENRPPTTGRPKTALSGGAA